MLNNEDKLKQLVEEFIKKPAIKRTVVARIDNDLFQFIKELSDKYNIAISDVIIMAIKNLRK